MVLARVHKLVLLVRGTKNAELGMLRAKVPYTHIHTQQTHTHTQEPTRESDPDDVLYLGGGRRRRWCGTCTIHWPKRCNNQVWERETNGAESLNGDAHSSFSICLLSLPLLSGRLTIENRFEF